MSSATTLFAPFSSSTCVKPPAAAPMSRHFAPLKNVLCCIDEFAKSLILLLFKPQFEVGISVKRDKCGVVKDEKAIFKAQKEFEKECASLGWLLKGFAPSTIKGKEGNVEFFYLYQKAKH